MKDTPEQLLGNARYSSGKNLEEFQEELLKKKTLFKEFLEDPGKTSGWIFGR